MSPPGRVHTTDCRMILPSMTSERRPGQAPIVRNLEDRDVAFAADLHHECLPDGFFAKLGVPFLNAYYGCFVRSPWAVCLIAEVDGRPAGVVVGTVDSWQHNRFVVRRCGWRLGRSGLVALVRRPRLALWFLRTRGHRYARGLVRLVWRRVPHAGTVPPPQSSSEQSGQQALLAHLAVTPKMRRNGAGGALVGGFLDAARARGVGSVRLLAAADQDVTRDFYEKLGWDQAAEVVDVDGKRWVQFVRDA